MSLEVSPVIFVDGPLKGTRNVIRKALYEGNALFHGDYQVQWDVNKWRWEAYHVQPKA